MGADCSSVSRHNCRWDALRALPAEQCKRISCRRKGVEYEQCRGDEAIGCPADADDQRGYDGSTVAGLHISSTFNMRIKVTVGMECQRLSHEDEDGQAEADMDVQTLQQGCSTHLPNSASYCCREDDGCQAVNPYVPQCGCFQSGLSCAGRGISGWLLIGHIRGCL